MRQLVWLSAILMFHSHLGVAAEPKAKKPIRALLVTGGCCHDYNRQKLILSKGISARADVVWTIAHQGGTATNSKIPLYEDPNWADGFDVVVHNECFSNVPEVEWVERILKPHREGLPAVLIHCAMHCYRTGGDHWFEFVGVQSPGHGPHYSYTVENIKREHPIMAGFPDRWIAPKGELYHSVKLFPTATPLAQAERRSDRKPQTCVWTNQYGKGRVFATTIGHYNETMSEPEYLDMVTRGLLWSVDRLDENSFRPTDEETNEKIKTLLTARVGGGGKTLPTVTRCCGEGNLTLGRKTFARSEEKNKNNFAKNAVDGNLSTRWCAASGGTGHQWQVELDKPTHVKSLRIHWEKPGNAYSYRIEASTDGEAWKTIVDRPKNRKVAQITPHEVDSPDTKHLRVTFLGSSKGMWASFWEFEAYDGELPALPKGIPTGGGGKGNAATVSDVQAPDGFNVTMFGRPPEVNYPVCLTAAATGEVFVGVDEQGSLGKEPNGGRVLRCIDTDGDGQADKINVFAEMDHPRGLIYDNGSLWVLHPPFLSVFHDDDRDGVSDRKEVLITGISTDEVNKRGADHTTNGIRMGIDGWIYIAVGDFGFVEAKGTDGRVLSRRGGGIVRVRPDGTDMEIFSWGQRNILDVCIDPQLNMFTRDNTNDGGGWDIRFSHILQSANYGYPSLYLNFTEESMPPLADYGGGSGCGAMYLHDLRWPEPFNSAVYTCDWGRSEVYRHNPPRNGATYDAHQEVFLKIPRPTDIDVDGSGRMYVSSWKNGKFAFSGPNVGFVAQITPVDFTPKPFPDLSKATDDQLIGWLSSPSAVYQLHSQRELLRRGDDEKRINQLTTLANDDGAPVSGRVAALFTLKQMRGEESHPLLIELVAEDSVREFALRALTDRRSELKNLPLEPFLTSLEDDNPRVRAAALIALGRLGRSEAAEAILPLTHRSPGSIPKEQPLYKQADPGRVIPHLAVQALVAVNGAAACLKGLDGPHADGALQALKNMHNKEAVDGLIGRLSRERDAGKRMSILTTLIRLYFREGDYTGGWWGTRPDRTGPYFDRKTWKQSERIASVIKRAFEDADPKTLEQASLQLARHKVQIEGLPTAAQATARETEPAKPIDIPKVDPNNPNQIANMPYEKAVERALAVKGNAEKGRALFKRQSCVACHTFADGQTPKGPHLVDIGKRYKPAELAESILKPSAKIAQGFDTYIFLTTQGKVITGFVTSESADTVSVRLNTGVPIELPKENIEDRRKVKQSMMPDGVVRNMTPEELADVIAFLQSLKP